jgi:hypothetical protein
MAMKDQHSICPQTCYVCVHRKRGDLLDLDAIPTRQRKKLAYLSARHVETMPSEDRHYAWADWYSIPMGERTLDMVKACLHGADMFDGPYWGMGKECRASGQTKKAGAHSENRHH